MNKTKKQLIDELASSRLRIKKLEKSGSERKQAEEALQKSEEKYRLLSESSQDGIYIIGTEGFEYVNSAFKKMLEYNKKEIFSKDFNFLDTIHPDDRKLITERKEARKKGKELPSIYSFRIITKSGKTKYVEVNTAPLPGEGTHILGILRDITDQKRTEEALQKSEAKYRSIFKNTGTASAIIEADMTMSLVNSEMEKLTGFSKKEIEGKKKWTDFCSKEDLAIMKKYHASRRKGGDEAPKRYEARLVNRAGEIRHVIVIVDMIPGTEQSVASNLDITERKQAEDKIKASLKEKEVLLQEIHHRVKNNMQIIVSLLRLQSYTSKDKKIEDMFKVAQNRIRSMAIIHEKLYKSKDFASIDFSYYIQSLITHLMQTYQIDPKKITLKTDVKDVHLDINQGVPVGLLINELVSNALKHAFPKGKKGEIIVKFHSDKKGKKTLVVKDNGVGFPDKVNISKPETLGMQLIKDLTRQIGGKLDLDTKAGTTFKITFS